MCSFNLLMGLPTHLLKEQKMTKATYSNSKDPKQKHRFKNLLLQPVIQLRIAAWSAFASAMFGKSIRYVAVSVLPALAAMFCGALIISALPFLATWLPSLF